jgi:hypothetical protein
MKLTIRSIALWLGLAAMGYGGDDWLAHWMAHELGHLETNNTNENEAEKAAAQYHRLTSTR